MKILFKIIALFLLTSYSVLACPNCGGSASSFEGKKIIILSIFILATYIPMSVLFKMAIKNRKKAPTNRNNC